MRTSLRARAAGCCLRACLVLLPASTFAFAQDATYLEVRVGSATRQMGAAELGALPQTEIVEARTVGSGAAAQSGERRYRGVLLRDVLDAAGIGALDRYALRHTAIVARARDDYVVLFSWGELFNASLGENVLVVTSVNGKPLPANEGPYALRSLSDTKPGPRHVKWLRRLDVVTVPKPAPGL
ncbi:molybdopterin-dependent oxidoreductase [Massilia sp. CMS3.1]|uniref:molybdopterin-dependent oxidoreductase n=1 Tax=Massilia sp. CMS3.1 TaxID=3373083 RepID=UPI003EE56F92